MFRLSSHNVPTCCTCSPCSFALPPQDIGPELSSSSSDRPEEKRRIRCNNSDRTNKLGNVRTTYHVFPLLLPLQIQLPNECQLLTLPSIGEARRQQSYALRTDVVLSYFAFFVKEKRTAKEQERWVIPRPCRDLYDRIFSTRSRFWITEFDLPVRGLGQWKERRVWQGTRQPTENCNSCS
jgi:hypothetical protein